MELQNLRNRTISNFNTYNNHSVLSHVLMPEGFSINIGFKFYNTGKVLKEALIGKSGRDEEKIHPGCRSYDGKYTELRISCCNHEIIVQSTSEGNNQYILVSPIKTQKKPPALLISAAMLWNQKGYVQNREDYLEGVMHDRIIRVYTDGEPLNEYNTGLAAPYLSVILDRPIAISTEKPVNAKDLETIMQCAKEKIVNECKKYGDLSEIYNAMRTCLAWDTIYEPENKQVCSPVSRIWSAGWGGYVLFCWDTYFASMLSMIDNKDLSYSNIIAITREKTENGFIPNFGAANNAKSRDRSQPPVGSLALKEIYRIYHEKWIVEYLFDDLLTWNRWFKQHRSLSNGQLCWGSDPYNELNGNYWETEGVNQLFGAALESGLDNSPMYDDVPFDTETHLMCLADVGLTSLYIMDCEALAELADVIDRPENKELRERAEQSKNGLEEMWDNNFGMYCNKRTDTGEFSHRISPTNFYSLFSDKVSDERADIMIDKHFYNPDEFWGDYMMPSIARNDPAYPDQSYWRGRIWAPMNYLVYIAMRKKRLTKACKELADKSKELLLLEWNRHGHIHENYSGDTGMGCGVNNSDKFYHWGALLSLITLMEAGYISGPEKTL